MNSIVQARKKRNQEEEQNEHERQDSRMDSVRSLLASVDQSDSLAPPTNEAGAEHGCIGTLSMCRHVYT